MHAAPPQIPIPVRCAEAPVCAGFPSPAEDYAEGQVDIARLLAPSGREPVLHARERGDGARTVHVLDPAAAPRPGDLVLARADGRSLMARVARGPGGRPLLLRPDGRPLRAGAAECVAVATWRLLGFRGGDPGPAGLAGLGAGAPSAFLFRVRGESMRGAGIGGGDFLLVDRAERPRHGDIVVAVADGARSVKRLLVEDGRARLAFENAGFPDPLPFAPETVLFGVATWAFRRLRP